MPVLKPRNQILWLIYCIYNDTGCELIFWEKVSNKCCNRPKLQRLLQQLSKGDKVVVQKLDCLVPSLKDLLLKLEKIEKSDSDICSITKNNDTFSQRGGCSQLAYLLNLNVLCFENEQKTVLQRHIRTVRPCWQLASQINSTAVKKRLFHFSYQVRKQNLYCPSVLGIPVYCWMIVSKASFRWLSKKPGGKRKRKYI